MNQNAPTLLGAVTGLISAVGVTLIAFTSWTQEQDTAVLGLFAATGLVVGIIGGLVVQSRYTDPRNGTARPDEHGAISGTELLIITAVILVALIFLRVYGII